MLRQRPEMRIEAGRLKSRVKTLLVRSQTDRGFVEAEFAEFGAEFLHRGAARVILPDEALLEIEELDSSALSNDRRLRRTSCGDSL